MELLMISLSTALNFAILRWKVSHGRFADAVLDGLMLFVLGYVFSGTLGGMVIAMCSGAIISIYLIFNPFQLIVGDMRDFKAKYTNIAKKLTIIGAVVFTITAIIYALIAFKII